MNEIERLILPQMMKVRLLKKEIDELEEEIEGYDFGSCMYDFCNYELEYSYARLDKLEKKS